MTTAMHMKVGDSATTMRLLCGFPIKDASWTNNPREVTCEPCKKICLP